MVIIATLNCSYNNSLDILDNDGDTSLKRMFDNLPLRSYLSKPMSIALSSGDLGQQVLLNKNISNDKNNILFNSS